MPLVQWLVGGGRLLEASPDGIHHRRASVLHVTLGDPLLTGRVLRSDQQFLTSRHKLGTLVTHSAVG